MGLSCSLCRYESQNRALFRREKSGSFNLKSWFCLGCKPAPKVSLGFTTLIMFGILAMLGALAVAGGADMAPLGYVLLAMGGWIVLTPLTVAIHEMGHAGVAALLGRRIYQINIGSGPAFKSVQIGHTQWTFGRDLSGGLVVQAPLKTPSRLGDAAILAAGAAANLAAACCLMFWADRLTEGFAGLAAFIAGSILSNAFTGIRALIPQTYKRDGHSQRSDGKQLVQLFRRPRASVDWQVHHDALKGGQWLQARRWDEAETHYRDAFARHPDQPGFLGVLLHVLAASKGYDAARTCAEQHDAFLRQEGQTSGPMAPLWSYTWSMAAWSFIRSSSGDLTAADTFLRKALQAGSSPYLEAVQGALLIRTGERETGLPKIMDNLKELATSADKLEFCDFILGEPLEGVDLKTADFQSYGAHLRTLA